MYDIVALGEILIDFTMLGKNDEGTELFGKHPGGAPANVLATVARYGGKASFIGKVGKDMFGEYLINVLKDNNIDTSGVITDEVHNTTLAFVSLDDNGDRHFSFYRGFGADVFIDKAEIPCDMIKNSKIFHFGSLSLTCEPSKSATDFALNTAKKNGKIISYDPNYRELLWKDEQTAVATITEYIKYADIIKLSKEEAELIAGSVDNAIAIVAEMGVKIILITDGANGVTYSFQNERGFVPAIKVKPVDTTGAGDIFFGTFLFEIIKNGAEIDKISSQNVKKYIESAVKTAGLSTQKNGAISSIPNYEEIQNI